MAYPDFMVDFNVNVSELMWINVWYVLIFTIGMPITGALGDRVGQGRIFVVGMVLFLGSAVLQALAWSFYSLLIFGLVEALAAAFLIPAQISLVHKYFKDNLGWAFGFFGVATSVAAIAGPALGGWIIYWLDWRYMFWLVAILAMFIFFLSLKAIPRNKLVVEPPANFNYIGAILYLITFGLLQIWLKISFDTGFLEELSLILLFITFASMLFFIKHEKGRENQIIPFKFIKNPSFLYNSLIALLIMTIVQGLFYLLPIYLRDLHNLSAGTTGIILMIEAIIAVLFAAKIGKIVDKLSLFKAINYGLLLLSIGILVLISIGSSTIILILVIAFVFLGVGQLFSNPALNKGALLKIDDDSIGSASGVYNTIKFSGGAFAASIFGPLLNNSGINQLQSGFNTVYMSMISMIFLAFVFSILLRNQSKSHKQDSTINM
jgi:predicted MFS family arabinose efflux permease